MNHRTEELFRRMRLRGATLAKVRRRLGISRDEVADLERRNATYLVTRFFASADMRQRLRLLRRLFAASTRRLKANEPLRESPTEAELQAAEACRAEWRMLWRQYQRVVSRCERVRERLPIKRGLSGLGFRSLLDVLERAMKVEMMCKFGVLRLVQAPGHWPLSFEELTPERLKEELAMLERLRGRKGKGTS